MRSGASSFLAAAFLLTAASASASTTQENLAKYTRLRTRLTTEFMVVGAAQGESQPAQERHEAQGFIKWADNTINLGWYIGVLATEYHMRSNPAVYPGAGDASKTLDELWFALNAMERVDTVADAAFPECGTTPSTNGFFLRDDVPDGFHQHFAGLTSTQSDFIDPVLTNKEMSQDQVYHVLMGLALVKHLVPASVTVKGKTLRTWAMDQSRRIGEHFAKGNWVIRNPACGNRAVNRGEQAIGYSAGTRLAFGFISDGAYVPTTPVDLWGTLKNPNNPAYNDEDNLHMAMVIAAVGNGWGTTTAQDLATLSAKQDWPLYPILHRVLHGAAANGFCQTTGQALNTRARTMIDEVPQNGEPSNPRPGPAAPHGFTTNNRFIRGKAQHYVGQFGGDGMRYSGTDFLLLHNLYAIGTPAAWTQGPNVAPCAVPPSSTDGGSEGGTVPTGTGGSSTSSGGPDPDAINPLAEPGENAGCACTSGAQDATSATAALALGAVVLAAIRKRRSKTDRA